MIAQWIYQFVGSEAYYRILVGGLISLFMFGPLFQWADTRLGYSRGAEVTIVTLGLLTAASMATLFLAVPGLALFRSALWVVTGV